MASVKFRPVRELFKEAMEEMVEIETLEKLKELAEVPMIVAAHKQCFDDREGWDDWSYLVIGRDHSGEEYPVGYLSAPLSELA